MKRGHDNYPWVWFPTCELFWAYVARLRVWFSASLSFCGTRLSPPPCPTACCGTMTWPLMIWPWPWQRLWQQWCPPQPRLQQQQQQRLWPWPHPSITLPTTTTTPATMTMPTMQRRWPCPWWGPQRRQQSQHQPTTIVIISMHGHIFFFSPFLFPLFPLLLPTLFLFRTIACLLISADSYCTSMTHPRILILGPWGCTMTHGFVPWLTFVCAHMLQAVTLQL